MNRLQHLAWLSCLLAGLSARADYLDLAGVQLVLDNDAFTPGRTDQWYTNGIRLSLSFDPAKEGEMARALKRNKDWYLWSDAPVSLSYTLGQSMYTPNDITKSEPQPQDRPWGAFLYVGVTAHASKGGEFRATELKLGTTGPAAAGRQAQSEVHRWTGSNKPMGWHNQLKTRLGVQLSHTQVWHAFRDNSARNRVGFQYGWGATVGSLRTYANATVAVTVGDLSNADSPILLGNEGDFVVQDFANRAQFAKPFAYLALNATGVAYNYFLEGKTPYGRPQISPRRGYGMLQFGVSLPVQAWVGDCRLCPRVVYTQTLRSAEFRSELPSAADTRTRWGTLALHWDRN
jgi:lipid A 3-O-deacylase